MMIASVKTPVAGAALVRWTYVIPPTAGGTVQAPFAYGVKTVPPGAPPTLKAQLLAAAD